MSPSTDIVLAGLYGSGLLNDRFHQFIAGHLRQDLPEILRYQQREATAENEALVLSTAVKAFEKQKKLFGSSDEVPFHCHISGLKGKFRNSRRSLGPKGIEIPRLIITSKQTRFLAKAEQRRHQGDL